MRTTAKEGKWRHALTLTAGRVEADLLFLYRLETGGRLVHAFHFPRSAKEISPILDASENMAREILESTRAFCGAAKKFGGAFSFVSSRFLLVSAVRYQERSLGILAAGLGKKPAPSVVEFFSARAEHLASLLAVEELEAENGDLRSRIESMRKELSGAYHRIVESEKLAGLGRFAGGLAHELNTPLAAIQTYAEYLQLFVQGKIEQESLDGILTAVGHSKEIIENVLRLSREKKPSFEPFSLETIIHDAILLTSPEMEKRKIRVVSYIEPGIPTAFGDHTAMVRVVTNLLTNARDAISRHRLVPRQGAIRVSAFCEEGNHVISVSDNGPGISPEIMGKIFDPFYTTKEVGEGTGLGLSICQSIVQEHGGKIEISSEIGKGTVVMVKIPVRKEASHV